MKSVVINSDKSIGFIEDYKGHTLLNVRQWDPGTAVKPEGVYVLEFSDEPVQDQLLTIEEQQEVLRCYRERAMHGHQNAYDDLHITLGQRFCPDVDGGE